MKKIDLRDYKILAELDKDCKTSFNQIGRILRLSPSVVERRIKKLIQKRVIIDFKSIINYKRLGWTYYSIYVRFQNMTDSKRKEIIEYLKKHPLAGQVLKCEGRWQFIYGFFSKDVFKLTEELKRFNDLFGQYIKESEKIIHTGSHHYFRGHLLNKDIPRSDEPYLGGPEVTIRIDKESYKLLNAIRQNARINLVLESEKQGITIDQIRYRLKNLTKERIILGTWLNLDPKKLGLNFYRILLKLKNFDQKKEKEFLSFMNKNKNVIRTNNIFGTWDYFIDLEIDSEGLRRFIDNFTNIFSDQIHEYETLMIYDQINYAFNPVFPIE
jgi:DNA-binding Lrp family transcriptional regulator